MSWDVPFHFVIQNKVVLPLPSLEVLSDVSSYPNRHAGVMHVLETSVVMWLKQIKVSFRRSFSIICTLDLTCTYVHTYIYSRKQSIHSTCH